MKTLSELTQKIWVLKDQTLRSSHFKTHCLKAIKGSGILEDDEIEDLESSFSGILPDGYKICNFCRVITALEIEDSHPLDLDKIRKYAVLWFDIDSLDEWSLQLCVTDRYGLTRNFLDLKSIYYVLLKEGELKAFPDAYEMEDEEADTKGR